MRQAPYLIHHFLERSADRVPDKVALIHGSERYTYEQLDRSANRVANGLCAAGVGRGDRVALLLRNSVAYVLAYYGTLKAGGVAVPLNTGVEASELTDLLTDSSPCVVLSETHFVDRLAGVRVGARIRDITVASVSMKGLDAFDGWAGSEIPFGCFSGVSDRRVDRTQIDIEPSSIIYTSGSTGRPKGAVLSHRAVVANTRSITNYLAVTSDERCLVVLPLYYVYAKSLLNTHFAVGGSVVLDNRFAFPNAVLKTMQAEEVTNFSGVPSTYSILLNRSAVANRDFPFLRTLTQAGGHLPVAVKRRLMDVFPHTRIFIMYGATEASARLSYLPPEDLSTHLASIGRPIPNVEMKILKGDGTEAVPGEHGEIVARGSNLMDGYWNDPEETQKVLRDGWYHTGDIGCVDDHGYFQVTGRKRDMIKVGIYKVSAVEIEEVLLQCPGVDQAAVVPAKDDTLGEVPVAYLVTCSGRKVGREDVEQFLRASELPSYKLPRQYVFLAGLPKNEAGKVMKNRLMTHDP